MLVYCPEFDRRQDLYCPRARSLQSLVNGVRKGAQTGVGSITPFPNNEDVSFAFQPSTSKDFRNAICLTSALAAGEGGSVEALLAL